VNGTKILEDLSNWLVNQPFQSSSVRKFNISLNTCSIRLNKVIDLAQTKCQGQDNDLSRSENKYLEYSRWKVPCA